VRGVPVLLGALAAISIVVAPTPARAGRSFFGWLQGTEVMPERSVELQNVLYEENRVEDDANRSESGWAASPFVGVTDRLELNFPFEVVWGRTPGMPGTTALDSYGIEARYRLVSMDPEDAPPFAPLIRASLARDVRSRDVAKPALAFVATYEAGSVIVGADLGIGAELTRAEGANNHFEAHTGLGVSVLAVGDLRFGAEAFAQLSLDDDGASWAVVGPNLSWTHGRFWVSATYGIGVYQIKDAPRMQWGIAF
jgi:hypothetical protein